jgi:hypothetical protein
MRRLQMDFCLFWHSVASADALRGALDFCLTEAEPWPSGGFTIHFKLLLFCFSPYPFEGFVSSKMI